ncbi:glycosyltransferase family 4 protein [Syntrophothermus lipocalidus]|uniref:Glycosyl transferase group 1 n=1 Tax=Syntrophothermus lipocalidus (strain DSM 12680 / TGB-C1) TaxID=643648 RepID=D7CKR3_SYNLT|nr:glycosyltransferase family 4 protein [Syntrophothermus lipocalidus]ADI01298.1 glycosyl transferase group 1 [Syntrophothermus lipocalidus DSM 12680]
MRVMMLSWEFPPRVVGGLAMHVYDLSTSMVRQGLEVTVVTCGGSESLERERVEGVEVLRVRPYDLPTADILGWSLQLNVAILERAIDYVNQEGEVDIIHAHDWLVACAARALKHGYRIPMVATVHATEYGRNNGLHNQLQRSISDIEWWLTYEAWRVICCSSYMVDEVRRVFNLPSDKIRLIPNGVYPERLRQKEVPTGFKDRWALPYEKIVFFVGRLVPEKGVQVLLEAVPKILGHCPEAKFVIAGTGPFHDFLRQKANDLGLGDKVCFTGYISEEDRDRLYQVADVAVFPSLYEPFGIVALEAMAAGTPVVVSDSGGLAEIVKNNEDGLWAITGSANSLADRVIEILTNRDLAQKLAHNAIEKVYAQYDWRIISAKTVEVYEEILKESKNSGFRAPRKYEWPFRRQSLVARRATDPALS